MKEMSHSCFGRIDIEVARLGVPKGYGESKRGAEKRLLINSKPAVLKLLDHRPVSHLNP